MKMDDVIFTEEQWKGYAGTANLVAQLFETSEMMQESQELPLSEVWPKYSLEWRPDLAEEQKASTRAGRAAESRGPPAPAREPRPADA